MSSRRGVSLVELLIALTISVLIGAAMFSMLSSSTRFEERNESGRSARLTARGAVNVLANDLRTIDPSWGIEAASHSSITVMSPYADGVVCDTTTVLTIMILPVDSVILATPGYSGLAWRSVNGEFTAIPGGGLSRVSSFPASCAAAGMQQMTAPSGAPNQKTAYVTVSGTDRDGISIGTVVLLYRRVRFYFAASAQSGLAGRMALWRHYLNGGAGPTEMVAPFDSSAAFNFYLSGASTPQTSVPSDLTTLRGFQLFLPGESENTPRQRVSPEQANLTTAVFFLNAAS